MESKDWTGDLIESKFELSNGNGGRCAMVAVIEEPGSVEEST